MRAGKLDRRLTLQSQGAPSGNDPESGAWSTVASVWARRLDANGLERFIGSQRIGDQSQGFLIRFNTDINPTWRIVDGTAVYQIVASFEAPDGRREGTVILCERVNPNDVAA